MPSLPEAFRSLLAADSLVLTSWVVAGGVLLIGAGSFHYASPQRLTRVLSEAMADVERTYLETVENGALSASDVHTGGTFSSSNFSPPHVLRPALHPRLGFAQQILKQSQIREITSRRLATQTARSLTSVAGV
ncbi:hypothetical protein B0H14DRAFT_3434758 [Mycena olivaceomarginata]|nr:hypothetical protein B0H14DRAFT_3434758 [Mycena olivaceomarginata]